MARFVTGNTFNTGDQVTATTLNDAVNNAKVSTDSVDGSTIDINTSGGVAKLRVKTATGASDGVALANIQHQPANTVLVRDANSVGAVSAKAVADTQILIGDGTGFTSAALSGDVTMTNAGAVTIADDAVTGAKISDSAVLPNGVTATTQSEGDNSTKVATTAYVDAQQSNVAYIYNTDPYTGHGLYLDSLDDNVVDDANIITVTANDIAFNSTGQYLIRFSAGTKDRDTATGDVFTLRPVSSSSSTANLTYTSDVSIVNDNSVFSIMSFSFLRSVSNTSTDKLAFHIADFDGANRGELDINNLAIEITKIA